MDSSQRAVDVTFGHVPGLRGLVPLRRSLGRPPRLGDAAQSLAEWGAQPDGHGGWTGEMFRKNWL